MAAIQSRWGRWLVQCLSCLSLLSALVWLAAMALMLYDANTYLSKISAQPTPSLDDLILSGHVELAGPVRQGTDGIAAPFGWVLGRTPCAQVLAQVPDSSQNASVAVILVGAQGVAALGVPGLLGLSVGCNADDVVDRVSMRFYKDRDEQVRMRAMARELSARYRVVQAPSPARQPNGKNRFAAWRADNAIIDLNYHIMDRNFRLEYADPCIRVRIDQRLQHDRGETLEESKAADAAYAACLRSPGN
ncbi:hypothetical protein [Castellaniella sp.]|uniref:hypothetical protein n=1 Tax=Castellaniella sp. TaxID=1955812 RepID=UPI002AFF3344|nr:hypothetical protein [Castellaniella sp.]